MTVTSVNSVAPQLGQKWRNSQRKALAEQQLLIRRNGSRVGQQNSRSARQKNRKNDRHN